MTDEIVEESRSVFTGRLIRVRVDKVRMPDGSLHEREIVEHPGAVAIVPVLPSGEILMVRQYRHAVRQRTLELPAGTRETGEEPWVTARRELQEETGYSAGKLSELVRFYVSPGWADEELIVYLARNIVAGPAATEPDEDLTLETIAPTAVADAIRRREIADSKSIVGLLAWLGIPLSYDQSTKA